MTNAPPAITRPPVLARPAIALPVLLWSLITILALWRVGLAWSVMTAPASGGEALPRALGAIVVHWRQLDAFVGLLALLLWLAAVASGGTVAATTLRQRRLGIIVAVWIGLYLVLTVVNAAVDQFLPGAAAAGQVLGPWADRVLAILVMVAAVRELYAIASEMPPGQVHLVPLWRFLATQWVLAWIAATVFLGLTRGRQEMLGDEGTRKLLFAIPAFGVLPNVLMIAGIRLWNARLRPAPGSPTPAPVPRVRAWLLAMILTTVAGILLILRTPWLGLIGGPLMLIAVALYLVGFPRKAWGPGKSLHLAAWGIFSLAIALVTVDRLLERSGSTLSLGFVANAWRHLLLGSVTLWGLSALVTGFDILGKAPRGIHRLAAIAALLFGIGLAVVTLLFLATSFRQGDAQVPVLRLVFWGALSEVLALFAIALFLPRLWAAKRA